MIWCAGLWACTPSSHNPQIRLNKLLLLLVGIEFEKLFATECLFQLSYRKNQKNMKCALTRGAQKVQGTVKIMINKNEIDWCERGARGSSAATTYVDTKT